MNGSGHTARFDNTERVILFWRTSAAQGAYNIGMHTGQKDVIVECIRRGFFTRFERFFNFGNFEASGNILTMAVGANAVLVPERLEFGAVYLTSLATQRDFNVDGLLVKMVFRY